ncbi:MAG: hypothetical protein N2595_01105, partial [bacterium]|nr:hypothetical protein [bacterium]
MKRGHIWGAAVICAVVVTGCVHVEPSTGRTYFLHTDYALFQTSDDPARPVSNYIGYCMLPMEDPRDERAQIVRALVEEYLGSNGYIRVTREELIAEPRLIPHTFLVGVGYVESFTYEEIQLQLNLYYVDEAKRRHVPFWSWKARYGGYPVSRRTVEPALRDLFVREPLDWREHGSIFPRRGAPVSAVGWFYEYLAAARLKVREAGARPVPRVDRGEAKEYNDSAMT